MKPLVHFVSGEKALGEGRANAVDKRNMQTRRNRTTVFAKVDGAWLRRYKIGSDSGWKEIMEFKNIGGLAKTLCNVHLSELIYYIEMITNRQKYIR